MRGDSGRVVSQGGRWWWVRARQLIGPAWLLICTLSKINKLVVRVLRLVCVVLPGCRTASVVECPPRYLSPGEPLQCDRKGEVGQRQVWSSVVEVECGSGGGSSWWLVEVRVREPGPPTLLLVLLLLLRLTSLPHTATCSPPPARLNTPHHHHPYHNMPLRHLAYQSWERK